MTPVELMTQWNRTGAVPVLNSDELRRFYGTLEQLAKLLATENITVNFFSTALAGRTASGMFDPVTRILYIAPFEEDMLHTLPGITVHEVSHALFTIMDDEVKEFIASHGVPEIWNIIEDGYCERQVCLRYSGVKKYLRMRFDVVFLPLWPIKSVDFLTDNTNILNYNCKALKYGYSRQSYSDYFTASELKMLHDAENCNDVMTMDRVNRSMDLLKMLLAVNTRIKLQQQSSPPVPPDTQADGNQNNTTDSGDCDSNTEEPDESTDKNMPSDESYPDDCDKAEHASGKDYEVDDEAKSDEQQDVDKPLDSTTQTPDIDTGLGESIDDAIEQFNQEVDSENIIDEDRELLSKRKDIDGTLIYRLATPQQLVSLSNIYDVLQMVGTAGIAPNGLPSGLANEKKYQNIVRRFATHNALAQGNAQLMFRRFAARANAENLKRVNYRTSGIIDSTRITQYQVCDDIFQQVRIQPNQINHGFVVMLDWSGSMRESTNALVHRVMELTHFAILAKVELEVWLYTSQKTVKADEILANSGGINDIIVNPATFIHVISTRKHSPQQCAMRLFNLFFAAHMISVSWHVHESFPKLSRDDKELLLEYEHLVDQHGTTITEAAIFATGRIQQMKCQKRSLILMTDGEDNPFSVVTTQSSSGNASCQIPFLSQATESGESVYAVVKNATILLKGVSVLSIIAKSIEQLAATMSGKSAKSNNTTMANIVLNPRIIALRAIIDTLRKNDVQVTALGWSLTDEKMNNTAFLFSLGGEIINIKQDLSNNASRTRHTSHYAQVDNKFIDELSVRLLGDIKDVL